MATGPELADRCGAPTLLVRHRQQTALGDEIPVAEPGIEVGQHLIVL
jgi:hypothetical protein